MKKKIEMKVTNTAAGAATKTAGAAVLPTAMVAYDKIRPDPEQPRKTFSEESLKELADSIREQGILQPLILEHVPATLKVVEPKLYHKEWQTINIISGGVVKHGTEKECREFCLAEQSDQYQIVCGERRWWAAGIAGLKEVPALVYRGLTAKQRFAFQFVENHQRENLTALEEAQGLKEQIANRKLEISDFSPEDLAKELGMSRASIYERLKLTRLHEPVRAALLAGKISTSVAGEVAKLPLRTQQEKLLEEITDESRHEFPYSVRDVQQLMDDEYVKPLSEAPFDVDVAYPAHAQAKTDWYHAGPCTACPNRTGNMLAEWPELKSRPNVCTQPNCFAAKCKEYWLTRAADLKGKGKTVLTTGEFRKVSKDYLPGDKYEYAQGRHGTFEELMGRHKPEPVLVATPEGLKRYYKKEEVEPALKANGVKLYERSNRGTATETAEEKTRRKAKEKERAARREGRQKLCEGLMEKLVAGIEGLRDAQAWELLAGKIRRDWGFADRLVKRARGNRARVVASHLGDAFRSVTDYDTGEWDKETLALWLKLGVDLVAGEQKAAPALPLAKGEPKQKEMLNVKPRSRMKQIARAVGKGKRLMSAAALARIAAAARARWAKIRAAKR